MFNEKEFEYIKVVRCKDCKYFIKGQKKNDYGDCTLAFHPFVKYDVNWYCPNGTIRNSDQEIILSNNKRSE